jgi:phosphate transport system substrate-binding protein
MNAAIDDVCDIGMASRELKDSEIAKGLVGTTIARDGIAVIVNLNNPIDDLSKEQVKAVFTGAVGDWSGLR